MKGILSSITVLLLAAATSASNVIDLTPKNFEDVVINSGKPTLVEFFAPWCGHCKTLAPIYEQLADYFEPYSAKVQIAKVDADAHKSLGQKYGVKGFPTLKFFPGKDAEPIQYDKGRDLESLTKFISDKTNIKSKAKKVTSNVQVLTDSDFDKIVLDQDKDVFVKFYAPWCGHCKSLAPIYENVATDYARDSDIVIAKIDCDSPQGKATAEKYKISGFPTLKFFPKGSTEPVDYQGGRTEEDILNYINGKAGTHRLRGGGLDDSAGTIEILDNLIGAKLATNAAEILSTLGETAKSVASKYAPYYVKVAEKLGAKSTYVEDELARLTKMVKKGGLAPEKLDDIIMRSNILRKFAGTKTGPPAPEVPKEDL